MIFNGRTCSFWEAENNINALRAIYLKKILYLVSFLCTSFVFFRNQFLVKNCLVQKNTMVVKNKRVEKHNE